jgi:SSS family solute:Na+ symporter
LIPALIVFAYLGVVLYIGIFAFRHAVGRGPEEFFLAGRSLGPLVFVLSLFGTNMTAFTILGSSGHSFQNGVVTFGLMASSSALIIPVTLLFIGTRVWALGKQRGYITPVQLFRDRWQCGHIGTVIFAVQAALLVPYIIIGVIGGGTTLQAISGGAIPYWLGGMVVAMVVMSYVFFGGMRGTAWVNAFQCALFLVFGLAALTIIGVGMGGFSGAMERMAASPAFAPLLTRERISPAYFFSYTFIPLSTIAFPHITIFCLTARRVSQFKRTVVLYPLCIAAIWLPSVFLGLAANAVTDEPRIAQKIEARRILATEAATLSAEERNDLRRQASADDVILILLDRFAPVWLAGLLGAGIMAAVMASDSQILALSTMFTEDVFAFYGHKERFGEGVQVAMGRAFVIGLTVIAYLIALNAPANIFELAVQYAFSGYAALSPLLVAALFWQRSNKWGALAATLWTAASVVGLAILQGVVPAPPPGQFNVLLSVGALDVITRTPAGTTVFGLLPVVPMTLISAALLWLTSIVTSPVAAPEKRSRLVQVS